MKKYFSHRKDTGQVISYSDLPNNFENHIGQAEVEVSEEDLELKSKGHVFFRIENGKLIITETKKKIIDEKKEKMEKLKNVLLEKKNKNEKFSDVEMMDFLLQIL